MNKNIYNNKDKQNKNLKTKKRILHHSNKLKKEIGGPSGPEPTRYGDWEINGRASDF